MDGVIRCLQMDVQGCRIQDGLAGLRNASESLGRTIGDTRMVGQGRRMGNDGWAVLWVGQAENASSKVGQAGGCFKMVEPIAQKSSDWLGMVLL
jgi:hypothetical protein